MYRLATSFWVSSCTPSPQGLSVAPLFLKQNWRNCPLTLDASYCNPADSRRIDNHICRVMLSPREIRRVRLDMFWEKNHSSLWTLGHQLSTQLNAIINNSLGMRDIDTIWITYKWARGERERLRVQNIRYLNVDDILRMQSLVKQKGKDISREELLCGLEDCCIYKEVWSRETGHMWEKYSLIKRKPSKEEYDYADTWYYCPVWLTDFPTEWILENLEKYVNK